MFSEYVKARYTSVMEIVAIFVTILIAVTVHEAMHGYVSNWLGDDTARLSGRLTLNPIAHIDPMMTILLPTVLFLAGGPIFGAAKPVPFNPYKLKYGDFGSALVAISGPLTNLGLAAFAGIILRLAPFSQQFTGMLVTFAAINVGFFVFNMIPIPPLDGSRLLYAFAPDWLQDIMKRIESFGLLSIVIFMLLFFNFLSSYILRAIISILGLLIGESTLNSL